jgi:hypothetical protein
MTVFFTKRLFSSLFSFTKRVELHFIQIGSVKLWIHSEQSPTQQSWQVQTASMFGCLIHFIPRKTLTIKKSTLLLGRSFDSQVFSSKNKEDHTRSCYRDVSLFQTLLRSLMLRTLVWSSIVSSSFKKRFEPLRAK